MKLDAASHERKNNFDVLRLAAATLVLISHSFVVVGANEPFVGHWPLGTLGVEIFFAISGFLVAKSWFAQPRLGAFAVKRGLRIVPALAVIVLALALVLGPALTEGSLGTYFHSSQTYTYPVDNVAATVSGGTVRHVALDLPGVFTSNPDHSVDKSLWTLPIEVRAYIALALVGALGLLSGGLPLLAIGFFALSVMPDSITTTPVIGSGLDFLRGGGGEASHLIAMFFFSALLYRYRTRVALRADLAAVAFVALVASVGDSARTPAADRRDPVPRPLPRLPLVGRPARGDLARRRVLRALPARLPGPADDRPSLGRRHARSAGRSGDRLSDHLPARARLVARDREARAAPEGLARGPADSARHRPAPGHAGGGAAPAPAQV